LGREQAAGAPGAEGGDGARAAVGRVTGSRVAEADGDLQATLRRGSQAGLLAKGPQAHAAVAAHADAHEVEVLRARDGVRAVREPEHPALLPEPDRRDLRAEDV